MQVNVGDPRFQGLFTSQDFALDPTDPQFSKAPGAPAILAEAARRKGSALPGEPAMRWSKRAHMPTGWDRCNLIHSCPCSLHALMEEVRSSGLGLCS